MSSPGGSPRPTSAVRSDFQRSGVAGSAALAIGVAVMVIGLVNQALAVSLPLLMARFHLHASQAGTMLGLVSGVATLLAAVGVVAGVIGLHPQRAHRLHSAAGLALCGAQVVSGLFGLIASVLLSVLT